MPILGRESLQRLQFGIHGIFCSSRDAIVLCTRAGTDTGEVGLKECSYCAHLASQRDAEGLCAEHGLACKREQRGIDCDGQLHGQLRGDHTGDDHGTIQQQLEAVPCQDSAKARRFICQEHVCKGSTSRICLILRMSLLSSTEQQE